MKIATNKIVDMSKLPSIFEKFGFRVVGTGRRTRCKTEIDAMLPIGEFVTTVTALNRYLKAQGWRILSIDGFSEASIRDIKEMRMELWGDLKKAVEFSFWVAAHSPVSIKLKEAYHWTPAENVDSILRNGLRPRIPKGSPFLTKGLGPKAVYLIHPNRGDVQLAREGLLADHPGIEQWALLKITNLDSFPIFTDCEYVAESGDTSMLYTTRAIPPENIEVEGIL